MKIRHKKHTDENFPVGSFLIRKDLRPLVMDYYRFARYGDDIADAPELDAAEKLRRLGEIEDVLYGKTADIPPELEPTDKLRNDFIRENLSFPLAGDLLTAFRRDAAGFEYQTWRQLTEYCSFSAVPVGRFMLAIHNENPSTYLPAAALCTALQLVNHVQDIKYDAKFLKRVYIPSNLLEKYGVFPDDLLKDKETPGLTRLKKAVLQKIKGLVKEAEILPSILKSRGLKMEIGVILSLTNIMIQKLDKADVLTNEVKLSGIDWIRSVVFGAAKGFFTRPKTLTTKGF